MLPTWMDFDQYGLFLKGIPPKNSLGQTIKLQIEVTDQIFTESQMLICPVNISTAYILQLLLTCAGPITFLYTLYQSRTKFFLYFCRKKYYISRTVVATPESEFYMVIPLVKDELQVGE